LVPSNNVNIASDMAPTNGVRHAIGFEPPPSSILATHVVHGDDSSDLNQASFNQLLEESLGTDENGQPNIGSDVSINHKLICIVIKAGIDPFIRDTKENPFHSNKALSKDDAQFSCCLDVIRTAIERSPETLFSSSAPEGHTRSKNQTPLYSWLVPKLLSLLTSSTPENARNGILRLLNVVLVADDDVLRGSGGNTLFGFTLGCATGTLGASASKTLAYLETSAPRRDICLRCFDLRNQSQSNR
jgi:hypothetical protein